MNKSMKILLCTVMCFAAVLIAVCSLRYSDMGRELQNCREQLAESRSNWERIAAEKEALQDILKEKQDELREAETSNKEAAENVDKWKNKVESLRNEIEELKNAH